MHGWDRNGIPTPANWWNWVWDGSTGKFSITPRTGKEQIGIRWVADPQWRYEVFADDEAVFPLQPTRRFNHEKKSYSVFGLILLLGFSSAVHAADPIEIALLYPLTGPLADPGNRAKAACDVAAEIINGSYDLPGIPYSKTQGIPNKGGAKIVLKYYDTQGSPEVGKAETERILQEGKAKLIIGAYQSSVTKPTSFVAERQKFPISARSPLPPP